MVHINADGERSPSPAVEKSSAASVSSADGEASEASEASAASRESESSAPDVAEFLLALSQSAPSPGKSGSSKDTSKAAAKNGEVSKSSRSARKPVVVHPLPKVLKQTRIAPLVFANKLSNQMDDTSLEEFFPDQFDTEFTGYEPSDFDIICGRGRGNFSHTGNQKLLDIIRERQDDYLKSNKRGKGALGKQILIEILLNGGRFVKLIDKKRQVWRVLPYKDVNTKIMHCIRDQINFQRKQGVSRENSMDFDMEVDDSRSRKTALDDAEGMLPPAKRQKGEKKLSRYLKNKYQHETGKSSPETDLSLGVSRAEPSNAENPSFSSKERSARMLAASLLLGKKPGAMEDPPVREPAGASAAPADENAGKRQGMGLPRFFSDTAAAKDQQEAMKMLGQLSDTDQLLSSHPTLRPSYQDMVSEKMAADIAAAQRAQRRNFEAHARALNFPLFQQLGAPTSALDLNQRLLLAARFGSPGFGNSFSDHYGRVPTTDSIVEEHIRQFELQQGNLRNHISALLGRAPAPGRATEGASAARAD
eukprot:scaffold5395_cov126-Cylindrotheca_fusiformis.AAC.5